MSQRPKHKARAAVAGVVCVSALIVSVDVASAATPEAKIPAKTSVAFLTTTGAIATTVTLAAHATTSVPVVLANIGGSPSQATTNPQLSVSLPPGVSVVRVDAYNAAKSQLSFHCLTTGSITSCSLVTNGSHAIPVISAQNYVLAALVLKTKSGFPVRQLSLSATAVLAGGGAASASVVVNAKGGIRV